MTSRPSLKLHKQVLVFGIKYTLQNTSAAFSMIPLETRTFGKTSRSFFFMIKILYQSREKNFYRCGQIWHIHSLSLKLNPKSNHILMGRLTRRECEEINFIASNIIFTLQPKPESYTREKFTEYERSFFFRIFRRQ